ncbi:MAG: hypothetical protein F6K24_32460 [Okeania sp. SIO2D1]|nr:hypothetical protein [Okeania sp. SIO2D1]
MFNRRKFILSSALIGGGLITTNLIARSKIEQLSAPGIITSEKMRPQIPYGVASGDISGEGRAVIWSRSDRPA